MNKLITILIMATILLNCIHFVSVSYATDSLWIDNTAAFYTSDPVYTGSTIRAGQVINVPNKNITIVSFYLTKVATPTGSAYCVIRKASNDAVLANSSALDVSTIPTWTTKAWFNFTILAGPLINEDVRIQFEFGGGSGASYPAMCLSQPAIDGNYTHYVSSYTNYSQFDMMMQIYEGTLSGDIIPPKYSNPSTNTTIANKPCNFSVVLTDETALANYTFGCNNTGHWVNETLVTISGTSYKANTTKTTNETGGTVIQWEYWFADSSNNLNNTGIQTLTLQYSLTFYWYLSSYGLLDYNGTVLSSLNNGTVYGFTGNDTILLIAFADLSRGNLGWMFFLHNGATVLDHPFIFSINQTNHIVWTYFAVEQIMFPSFSMSPTIVNVNQTVTFDCSGTWTLYYPIVSSYWDFGDGHFNTTTGTTTTHAYDAVGNYTVTVYPDDGYVGFGPSTSRIMSVVEEEASWYIAPGFILGFICFLGVGFVFIKKRRD